MAYWHEEYDELVEVPEEFVEELDENLEEKILEEIEKMEIPEVWWKEQLEEIEVERNKILQQAIRDSQEEVEAVKREVRKVRRKLKDAASLNRLKKLQKQTEQIETSILEPERVEAGKVITKSTKKRRRKGEFMVGDTVMVLPLSARGKIISLETHEAVVAVGRLHMRAQLEELEFKEREDEPEMPLATGKGSAASPGMELDLRGKRVDEGLQALDQYLDAAFLANLPWVRIIHGKGTGRLRQAVRAALKENSHVVSYEEGRDGEGGAGVTVAKFEAEA